MPHNSEADSDVELQRLKEERERLCRELGLLEDPETICSFGQLAYDGDGVEQNYAVAAGWYRIAAEQGNSRAQHNLALMYESGEGIPQNFSEAAKWYCMAAEQDNPGSQNNLGMLYEVGDGVPQDYTVALEWYRRAAESGDLNARANLKRLTARIDLEHHQGIVFAFSDLAADHSPLIGDAALLPQPKATILYAIKLVLDDNETTKESATDSELIEACDKMISTLNYLSTSLARSWHDIDPEDRDSIARLSEYDFFPEWALPLKHKYEERGSKQAFDAAYQYTVDKVKREMTDEDEVA